MRYRYIDEGRQHLHTLDGKPLRGCSSIVKIIGKGDGLINWAANCAVDFLKEKFCAFDAIAPSHPDNLALFEEARTAHVRKRDGAAEKGTERHGLLEEYVRNCLTLRGGLPIPTIEYANLHPGDDAEGRVKPIQLFIEWSVYNVEKFLFTEANCYSEKLWVGGIADIGMLLKDGRRVVGDHKSGPRAYFNQFIQCAIYDVLLSESGGLDADGNKLFDWEPADGYVVFPFRSKPFTPEFRWDVDNYRKAAEEVVHLYSLENN